MAKTKKSLLGVVLCAVMAICLTLGMAFSVLPMTVTATGGSEPTSYNSVGKGTASKPYEIGNLAQLNDLAAAVNGTTPYASPADMTDIYFVLTADIGSEATPFTTPIGRNPSDTPFAGNFDGAGHTVTLDVDLEEDNVGLFGVCRNATISNLTTAGKVTGDSEVGGICGYAVGVTISGCVNNATVTANNSEAGGICGTSSYLAGRIVNCVNNGAIAASGKAGGICGYLTGHMVSNPQSGEMEIDEYGYIENCLNTGKVTVTESMAGGICGSNAEGGRLINCVNIGEVPAATQAGAIVGYDKCEVINCYAKEGTANDLIGGNSTSAKTPVDTAFITDANMKATTGTDALIIKLNGYITANAAMTADYTAWSIAENGYPEPAHKSVADIPEGAEWVSSDCTPIWFKFDNGTLTIGGMGAMSDAQNYASFPWYKHAAKITSVVVAPGVTNIPKYAFYSYSLSDITISENVESIAGYAFYNDTNLKTMTVKPKIPPTLGNKNSTNLNALEKIYVPAESVEAYKSAANWSYFSDKIVGFYTVTNGAPEGDKETNHGSITVAETAAESETVTITVTPNEGYALKTLTAKYKDGAEKTITPEQDQQDKTKYTFKMPAYAVTVTAEFEEKPTVTKPDGAVWLVNEGDNHVWYKLEDTNGDSKNDKLTVGGEGEMPDLASRDAQPWASERSTIEQVIVQSGVTVIGKYAFYGFSAATSVAIPSTVTKICESVFSNCKKMESLYIDSIESWCKVTLEDTSSYSNPFTMSEASSKKLYVNGVETTEITIPSTVKSISKSAFYKWSNLTSVTISEGVESIGNYAFNACSGLTTVKIPEGVTNVGTYVFKSCSSLGSVTIPSSLKNIGNYMFAECSGLESVTISAGVESIGDRAFEKCSSLKTITIPPSVKSIGKSAFANCKAVQVLNIDSIESWCGVAIESNGHPFSSSEASSKKLYVNGVETTEITIPATIKSILNNAFLRCSDLKSVTIPAGVESIGANAFNRCSGLTTVKISSTVTSVGANAFASCSALSALYIDSMESWLSIDFNGATANPFGDSASSSKKVYVNNAQLKQLVIPDTIQTIPNYVYAGWNELESVTIPSSVKSIGTNAFANCSKLTSVTIPSSVTNIESRAFAGCSLLKTVRLKGTTPPALNAYTVFPYSNKDFMIYVPVQASDAYKNADNWNHNNLKGKIAGAYFVDVANVSNGTVTVSPEFFPADTYTEANATVTVTVTPDEGYALKSLIYNDGENHDILAAKSFTMPLAGVTVTAVIEVKTAQTGISVTMDDYTYAGILSTPDLSGEAKENPTVTYYYNTENNTTGGTKWESMTGTSLNAGTYYMYAVLAETATYLETTTATQSFVVDKAEQPEQTVTMEDYIYGETPSAPGLSGDALNETPTVTYYYNATDSTVGGTEWKNITDTTLDAGTYYMYAVIGATTNYAEATTGTKKFTVARATQPTVTVTMSDYAYSGTPSTPGLSASVNGSATVTYYYSTENVTTGGTEWKDIIGTTLSTGDYYIYAVIAETKNYEAETTQAVKFTVTKAAQPDVTVTMNGYTYGTTPNVPGLSASVNESPTVTYYYNATDSTTGGTKWESMTGTTLNAGTYYMYAVIAETTSYAAKTTATKSFTISKLTQPDQTVTMDGYTYGATPSAPGLSGDALNETPTVTYYYSTENVTTGGTEWKNVTGTTLTAGDYYMYAVISATTNYAEATTATKAFTITRAQQSAPKKNEGYLINKDMTVTITDGFEISEVSGDYGTTIADGAPLEEGKTYYIRRAADGNHEASAEISFVARNNALGTTGVIRLIGIILSYVVGVLAFLFGHK